MLAAALLSSSVIVNYASRLQLAKRREFEQTRLERIERAKVQTHVDMTSFVNELQVFMDTVGLHTPFSYFVGVDVGATNTRVAILIETVRDGVEEGNGEIFLKELTKFQCNSVELLTHVLNCLNDEVLQVLQQGASAAALALAGPIEKDNARVVLTNYEEGKQELLKSNLPGGLFPFSKTRFLNDLEACSYGLISEGLKGSLGNYFVPAFSKRSQSEENHLELEEQTYAVLAMGTGLGCGLILSKRDNNGRLSFSPLALEAGHVLVGGEGTSSESYTKEKARLEYISARVWNSQYDIEYEDICSGRGLKYCYDFELEYANKQHDDSASSAQIAQDYKKNEHARYALEAHYSYLMKAAQNICVMIPSCKGVFFAGDNQVNNEEYVNDNLEFLEEKFLSHPKRHWLEPVRAFRQIEKKNFNLVGCYYCAQLLGHGKC